MTGMTNSEALKEIEAFRRATIDVARDHYCSVELDIDDEATIMEAVDGSGVWVQAWVYVRNEDIEEGLAAEA